MSMNILEISLLTNNIQGTRSFYEDILGLPVININSKTVTFQAGHSILIFNLTQDSDAKYHFAFNIPGNKLDEAFEWINSKIEILPVTPNSKIADFTTWNAKSFYFHDNNENILEFIARFDLQIISKKPFSSTQIVNISEIGFVVPDVPEAAKYLVSNELFYFSKGPVYKDFTVLGDDNGLVLLTHEKRGWMPSAEPAKICWTKATVQANGSIYQLILNEKLSIKPL